MNNLLEEDEEDEEEEETKLDGAIIDKENDGSESKTNGIHLWEQSFLWT